MDFHSLMIRLLSIILVPNKYSQLYPKAPADVTLRIQGITIDIGTYLLGIIGTYLAEA